VALKRTNLRVSTGIDIIEINRIAKALERWQDRFLHKVFTDREQAYCDSRVARLAGRWVAKEAVAKALGLGFSGVSAKEIEIVSSSSGQPKVNLHGRARNRADEIRQSHLTVSISHIGDLAIAVAVGVPAGAEERDEAGLR